MPRNPPPSTRFLQIAARIAWLGPLGLCAAGCPAHVGVTDPLATEERVVTAIGVAKPGELGDILREYTDAYRLTIALGMLGRERQLSERDWAAEDVAAVETAAKSLVSSRHPRARHVADYALAMARFQATEPGGLAGYLAANDLDADAAMFSIYWSGAQRARVTDWNASDVDAVHRFLAPLAAADLSQTGWVFVCFVAAGANEQDRVESWWRADLPDAEAGAWTHCFGRAAGAEVYQPSQDGGHHGDDLPGIDVWLTHGLAAPLGTEYHRTAVEAALRRCAITPAPTSYSCAEIQWSEANRPPRRL